MKFFRPLLVGLLQGKRISGAQFSFKNLIFELTRKNYKFRVVNLGNNKTDHRIGEFSWERSFEIIRAILKAWVYIPFSNPIYLTVGLSRLGFLRDLLILLPAFILQKKTIIHVHSGGYGEFFKQQPLIMQKLIKFMISKVDIIIILSKLLKIQFDFLEKELVCVPVHNMIDPAISGRQPTVKQLIPNSSIQLLYLSNMMVDKGYLELLEACSILKKRGKVKFVCNFCGDFIQTTSDLDHHASSSEILKNSFFSKIRDEELEDCVNYLGVVKGEAKLKLLDESHLFILPTRYPWEGQPISILEAMASGIPVIATNYRSIPDQVQDGVTGYLLSSPNPKKIADLIEELSKNPDLYQEMSDNAIKKFWNEFSPELRMQKMIQILFG